MLTAKKKLIGARDANISISKIMLNTANKDYNEEVKTTTMICIKELKRKAKDVLHESTTSRYRRAVSTTLTVQCNFDKIIKVFVLLLMFDIIHSRNLKR